MHPWNQPILDALRQRLDSLPHALLFHGPQGVGKLALAETAAQLLLCEHADPARRPCGHCDGCRWMLAGSHPDLRRIEPEALAKAPPELEGEEPAAAAPRGKPSNDIKVDQVRELAAFLNVGSHRGRRRVALVHPAEAMNPNAANALLKGLEEPPSGAVFLLVSHRPARLLPTIRSRCVAIPVGVPAVAEASKWLKEQGASAPERWLRYAGGAPLRALEYAQAAESLEGLLEAIRKRSAPIDDRAQLEALAEALQKLALDRALAAFGAEPKYGVGKPVKGGGAKAWLAFARRMGENRALARHPLNARLFAAEMLAAMPRDEP